MKPATMLFSFAVVVGGCPPGDLEPTGNEPAVEITERVYEGVLSFVNEDDPSADGPGGSCKASFTLRGEYDGPWCTTDVASCSGGLAEQLGADSLFRLCFHDSEEDYQLEEMTLDFVETPCQAEIDADEAAYLHVGLERLKAEIDGEGFCDFPLAHLVVSARRTD